LKAKLATSFRGYDISIYPLKNPFCYKLLWQKLDKVHTISDDLLQVAYKLNLPPAIPVEKITPAIDAAYFQRMVPMVGLPVKGERPLAFLTIARLHWKKGLEYTLSALALLKEQNIDFQYTIIGEGEEYERLVFAAHQLGIGQQVHFVGKVPHSQIKTYYEKADIYLQYSIQEGFCNAVLEAQAMGLLCIVSDAEGLSENILHGQTGWVVPKRKPALLAQQIEAVLQMDAESLQQIRRQAIQRVQQEFNLEKQQQAFAKFYEILN
jgi:colanic acid/amylovoran biosynthesis glycosyltransferase